MNDMEFQDIYNTFYSKIHRYLKRLVGESEAEDLTQEVFLKVSRGLSSFRGESKLSAWIYRIATNAAMDKLRSTSFLRMVKDRVSIDSEAECHKGDKDEAPPVAQQLVQDEMNGCIRRFIDKLSGSYRSVVILSELEGVKNKEIADILGVSLDIVKIRLHRARERLKKELMNGCSFYRNKQNVLSCDLKDGFEEFKKTGN
ncbi:MAG: RNA polymerase sigma factor [bacterium]|nr:RNA polymerase sigma factor [bacterium]